MSDREPFAKQIIELRSCEDERLVTRKSAYRVCADKIEAARTEWDEKLKELLERQP